MLSYNLVFHQTLSKQLVEEKKKRCVRGTPAGIESKCLCHNLNDRISLQLSPTREYRKKLFLLWGVVSL